MRNNRSDWVSSMSRLFLSATRKSSGKTIIAVGIIAAFAQRGFQVKPFKKGPDYIDPMWLAAAAGNACINLDFHTMNAEEIRGAYHRHAASGDFAVIEGNKGLFDGVDLGGADSNAALAKILSAPVLLVIDARGMTRGIAPLLIGYQTFDPAIRIAGVILNHVGGARHESKLRAAVEKYTDIAVVGAVHASRDLQIAERHLGLITNREASAATTIIQRIATAIAAQVDICALRDIAARAAPLCASPSPQSITNSITQSITQSTAQSSDITIAIARDAAFGFYYADDLLAFEACGARLLPFDTMNDATLPESDGLYIGGGFPETHAAALAGNATMRAAVKHFVECGAPVYAECGGLMYLAQNLTWSGKTHAMAGALPLRVEMTDRPVGRGYVVLEETNHGLWRAQHENMAKADTNSTANRMDNSTANRTVADIHIDISAEIPAHEFHYSRVLDLPQEPSSNSSPWLTDETRFAYRVKRGYGINGRFDGLVYRNTLANYSHFRNTAANPWVQQFVDFVRTCKANKQPTTKQSTQ